MLLRELLRVLLPGVGDEGVAGMGEVNSCV